MYVTDSLFYLQHLVGGNENDEDRMMFVSKYHEIIEDTNEPAVEKQSAEDIKDRMIAKSLRLASGEQK